MQECGFSMKKNVLMQYLGPLWINRILKVTSLIALEKKGLLWPVSIDEKGLQWCIYLG